MKQTWKCLNPAFMLMVSRGRHSGSKNTAGCVEVRGNPLICVHFYDDFMASIMASIRASTLLQGAARGEMHTDSLYFLVRLGLQFLLP